VIDRIISYLKNHGGKATRKEVMRDLKIKSKEFTEYLLTMFECTLAEQREVKNDKTGRNIGYIFLLDQRVEKVGKVIGLRLRDD
jgi:hypothetical protein